MMSNLERIVLPEGDINTLGEEIISLMLVDDFVGLGKQIESLYKMPQSLCKMQGKCCKFTNAAGGLNYDELVKLTKQTDDPKKAQNAKDFLDIFIPHSDQEAARNEVPQFMQQVKQFHPDETKVMLFHCKYLAKDNTCSIHEDRPSGCRTYPFPHEKTLFHEGCGYETEGKKRHVKIEAIQKFLTRRQDELAKESAAFWENFNPNEIEKLISLDFTQTEPESSK